MIRARHGPALSAKTWLSDAPLRMLMSNLDPDVAEKPKERVVYGGIGRAARDWRCYDRIVDCLKDLNEDETLAMLEDAKAKGAAISVGLLGNCAEILPGARCGCAADASGNFLEDVRFS